MLVPDFLNDEEGIINDYSQNISKRYSVEEIVDYALQIYHLEAPEYATTNFVVGEFILKAVTGQMIQMVTQDLVYTPLGLENMELPDPFSDGQLEFFWTLLPHPTWDPHAWANFLSMV